MRFYCRDSLHFVTRISKNAKRDGDAEEGNGDTCFIPVCLEVAIFPEDPKTPHDADMRLTG